MKSLRNPPSQHLSLDVHGLAHITGSGLWNIPRLKENVKYIIEDPVEPQPIFSFLQKYGNIDDREMYQTFNMGMGMAIIVAQKDADQAIKVLKKYSEATVKVVGKADKGTGVEVPKLNLIYR